MTDSKKHMRHQAHSEPKLARHDETRSNLPAEAFNKLPDDHEKTARAEPAKGENKAESDVWMYRAEGQRLFKAGDIIPPGYVDTPAKLKSDGNL